MKTAFAFLLLLFALPLVAQTNKKITDYPDLGTAPDSLDWFLMHDTSANGYRKIGKGNLFSGLQPINGNLTSISNLPDPGADRIVFWDESENEFKWLIPGSGLTITDDTIAAAGGGGGGSLPSGQVGYGNGSGVVSEASFLYDPTNNLLKIGSVELGGSNGVVIEADGAGDFTLAESTTGEELTFDFGTTANQVILKSATTLTAIDFGTIPAAGPLNAYDAGTWSGSRKYATEDAVRNKIESLTIGAMATDVIWNAKGDLAVGTGSDTASRLGVGANGTVLVADSAEATGLKWATISGTGDVTAASAFATDNRLLRSDGTGKGAQASAITVDDSGNMSGIGTMSVTTLNLTNLNADTISFDDSDASHQTVLNFGSNLTSDRSFDINTGDADRTLVLQGDPTLGDWFNQSVKSSASPTFAGGSFGAATATTPAGGDNDTSIATTAFVQGEISGLGGGGLTVTTFRDKPPLYEEFQQNGAIPASAAFHGAFGFQRQASGTGATMDSEVGQTGASGIASVLSGTTTTGYSFCRTAGDAYYFGGSTFTLEGRFWIPVARDGTDDYSFVFGFHDATTVAAVDGAYFLYDNASANWQIVTRSNSTGTATASSTAVAIAGWVRLQIVVNAAASSVAFYVDGTQVNVSPLTSNIPTAVNRQTGMRWGIVKSAGTTDREVWCDYIWLDQDYTTSR